jgi:hypothetical protein
MAAGDTAPHSLARPLGLGRIKRRALDRQALDYGSTTSSSSDDDQPLVAFSDELGASLVVGGDRRNQRVVVVGKHPLSRTLL